MFVREIKKKRHSFLYFERNFNDFVFSILFYLFFYFSNVSVDELVFKALDHAVAAGASETLVMIALVVIFLAVQIL